MKTTFFNILFCAVALGVMPLLGSKIIHAQPVREWKALQVGDTVPDFSFQLVNSEKTTGRFSDYLGKHILVDFWATWCTSCLIKVPLLDSLQKVHADKLTVVLINTSNTGDNEERLKEFFIKREKATGKKFPMPSIAYDTITEQLFPHRLLPHYVFISPEGVVQSFSGLHDITANTIRSFIKNEDFAVREKIDRKLDHKQPLFFKGNGGEPDSYIHRSLLTGYVSGLPGSYQGALQDDNLTNKIHQTNMPLQSLYLFAYPQMGLYPNNRKLVQINEPHKFYPRNNHGYDKRDYLYCYELLTPPVTFRQAKQMMREDLKRYFGYEIWEGKKELTCLVLKNKKKRRTTEKGVAGNNLNDKNAVARYIRNQPLVVLVKYLDGRSTIPVIDETKYVGNITMELPVDLTDIPALQEALSKYGFTLTEEKRKVDCFMIAEPGTRL